MKTREHYDPVKVMWEAKNSVKFVLNKPGGFRNVWGDHSGLIVPVGQV